jgi:hypothetical protein
MAPQVLAHAGGSTFQFHVDNMVLSLCSSIVVMLAGTARKGLGSVAANPLGVSRYRERHSVARAKSDSADAVALANIVSTPVASGGR